MHEQSPRTNSSAITLQTGVKRPLSTCSASTVSNNDLSPNEETPFTEVKSKPIKKSKNETADSPVDLDVQLRPAKEYIDSNEKTLPMSYEKLMEFLESTKKKSTNEIAVLAKHYCNDFEALSAMLTNTYKHVSGRTIRSRLTRDKNSLSPPDGKTQDGGTDTESTTGDLTLVELADHNQFSLINNDGANE
ncbi:hypothetical protein QAD02_012601 [Eretmocerus hayati]|uniref:Uncharacterized protein n=1 Tax=Eretmocerus hayati TaxID=131215 RepID=A0ACC2P0F5_9HYME|nr:hypothetical protein QAD02_012601 [Eretmocerus hayati]